MAELADARDSKSRFLHRKCGFDPHFRHQINILMNENEKYLAAFQGVLEFIKKKEDEIPSFKKTNIEHKRIFWNNISNLTAAEIAALILVLTSDMSTDLTLNFVALIGFFITLLLIQVYLFLLLFVEGRDIDKLESTLRKFQEEANEKFVDFAKRDKPWEGVESEFKNWNKSFWGREFKFSKLKKGFNIFITSDITPGFLLILFLISSGIFLLSIDLIRCLLESYLN